MNEQAHARRTDPATAHAAAASVAGLRAKQRAVYVVLGLHGGLTDEQLLERYNDPDLSTYRDLPRQSDSGLRTRRSELVDQGLVVDSGQTRQLDSGRYGIVWRLSTNDEREAHRDRIAAGEVPARNLTVTAVEAVAGDQPDEPEAIPILPGQGQLFGSPAPGTYRDLDLP